MSYLDGLLGRILANGTAVPLQRGLDFSGGLLAVENVAASRVDVSLSLLDTLIAIGYQEQYSARNTSISSAGSWYYLQVSAPAPLGICSAYFSGLGFTGGIQWLGDTATVLAVAALTPDTSNNRTFGFRWALNGAEIAGSERQIRTANVGPPVTLATLIELSTDDTLAVQVCNYTDGADVTTTGFAAAYVAFGGLD